MEEVRPSNGRSVRFGVFEVDLRAAELRKQGFKIKLQDQPFQILQILLENPGQVVTREAIQKRIWPSDTFVDFDHGLYNAIKRLREALGGDAETPRYIKKMSLVGTSGSVREADRGHFASIGTSEGQGVAEAAVPCSSGEASDR